MCRLSGTVHTGVEVHRINSEVSRLVERPWLQLMCCTVCLPHDRNFVVATTRHSRTNDLTTSKALQWAIK